MFCGRAIPSRRCSGVRGEPLRREVSLVPAPQSSKHSSIQHNQHLTSPQHPSICTTHRFATPDHRAAFCSASYAIRATASKGQCSKWKQLSSSPTQISLHRQLERQWEQRWWWGWGLGQQGRATQARQHTQNTQSWQHRLPGLLPALAAAHRGSDRAMATQRTGAGTRQGADCRHPPAPKRRRGGARGGARDLAAH